jgi:hypothetical protein
VKQNRSWSVFGVALAGLAGLAALAGQVGERPTAAKPLPPVKAANPQAAQLIAGYPLTITVQDDTRMEIDYRDTGYQFFGQNAEGAYLWANVAGTTKVFGPDSVPAGNPTNTYTSVSNSMAGAGTPANPWVVTTVNDVPGTNLRLTQRVTYVNGAEFTGLSFQLQQIGGSGPVTATLFHAADLYTNANDDGYGYYDPATGGIGDVVTASNGIALYQEFVPNTSTPANAYMEGFYHGVWDAIGDVNGPGAGLDNTVVTDTLHDSGAALQWNLTIPANGSVTVGDTDLFSPHASLCGAFSDVAYGSYNYDFIYYLACHGIVSGYADTTFRPNNPTTRGQLAKIASNSAGYNDTVTVQSFADVPPSNTFYVWIQRIASRGLISGYACGGHNPETGAAEPCDGTSRPYFRPSNVVSRGQIAKILANTRGLSATPTGQTFADVPVGSTYYLYVERLVHANDALNDPTLQTINGYACGGTNEPCDGANRPYFRLNNNATRGQIAKIDKLAFFPTATNAPTR